MSGGPEPPLDYRNPDDDREPDRGMKIAHGMVYGLLATAGVGVILVCGTLPVHPRQAGPLGQWPQVALFATMAAASVALLFWPTTAVRRRSLLLGFLIGVLVMALIEGICFSAS